MSTQTIPLADLQELLKRVRNSETLFAGDDLAAFRRLWKAWVDRPPRETQIHVKPGDVERLEAALGTEN